MRELLEKTEPKVSVAIITYNHEPYIRKAIDGVLMQEVDFPIEIIIHDDASTDKTSAIVSEYARRYPNMITAVCQRENQKSRGRRPLVDFVLPRCRGKYIALCEGDDYWTNSHKLQQQVDFLDAHPTYSGCAHQAIVKSKDADRFFHRDVRQEIGLKDLLDGRLFHTASFVCRAVIFRKIDFPKDIISLDQLLFIWAAAHGSIRFFKEPMCVYRKHKGGISSWVTYDILKSDLILIPWLEENISGFPKYKFLSHIHKTLFLSSRVPLCDFIKHYFLYIFYSFAFFPANILKVGKITWRYFPRHFWFALTRK